MEAKTSSNYTTLAMILVGLAVRVALESRVGFLKHYPYFSTPLTDVRQLFEAISNFELSGEYFLDHNAIN